ncbi:MAG: hypothetical protein M1833_003244 [Piccolia ochrophora]|nr:MAG: hypothetical protein M1833_003244 [Piccolia ochrophora]
MGLAAPRKKAKISEDPNNTLWTRSTSKFGHRILVSQGWSPGDFLGARNAHHADTYSAANASHIRVVPKEGSRGLGSKITANDDANRTGLDGFQSVLGRLNGKSEAQLLTEKSSWDDVKRGMYIQSQGLSIGFVSGGFLVGDETKELPVASDMPPSTSDGEKIPRPGNTSIPRGSVKTRKSKRKGEDESRKRGLKEESLRRIAQDDPTDCSPPARDRQPHRFMEEPTNDACVRGRHKEPISAQTESQNSTRPRSSGSLDGPDCRKEEDREQPRAERREERRERKKAKRLDRAQKALPVVRKASIPGAAIETLSQAEFTVVERSEVSPAKQEVYEAPTKTTPLSTGRHALRQKSIRQKRMAMMDTKALNEIFMIKT